mmetsp:Transcript_52020/g.96313  ORF Transcript_52020/g.96313 Transcript_52020/m.96313 type:complete len:247 (+) Transcript_52020:760-1500(+)
MDGLPDCDICDGGAVEPAPQVDVVSQPFADEACDGQGSEAHEASACVVLALSGHCPQAAEALPAPGASKAAGLNGLVGVLSPRALLSFFSIPACFALAEAALSFKADKKSSVDSKLRRAHGDTPEGAEATWPIAGPGESSGSLSSSMGEARDRRPIIPIVLKRRLDASLEGALEDKVSEAVPMLFGDSSKPAPSSKEDQFVRALVPVLCKGRLLPPPRKSCTLVHTSETISSLFCTIASEPWHSTN